MKLHHLSLCAILLALLAGGSGLLLSGCSSSRPIYTGPGGTGSTLPVLVVPTWQRHDTACTYVSATVGQGYHFNELDRNPQFGLGAHRAWAAPNISFAAGALAYGGRLRIQPDSRLPLTNARYTGLGVQARLLLHVRSAHTEWRLMEIGANLTREWGPLTAFRRAPYFTNDNGVRVDLQRVNDVSSTLLLPAFNVGVSFLTMPAHPWALRVGLGTGLEFVAGSSHAYLVVQAGSGLLTAHVKVLGMGSVQINAVGQFGLTAALPPTGRRRATQPAAP